MPIKRFLSDRAMRGARQGKGGLEQYVHGFEKSGKRILASLFSPYARLSKTKKWTREGVRQSYEKEYTSLEGGLRKSVLIEYDPKTGKRIAKTVRKNW
ncbi:MAG: hypothetical protein NTZ73_00340 [Candidatus Diapherotrites archaeon]|nr:hypothetical protein [Candidatus Diapherotrites archaeon]